MTPVDMSARAVATRLMRTSQLRRLCLALGIAQRSHRVKNPTSQNASNSVVRERKADYGKKRRTS